MNIPSPINNSRVGKKQIVCFISPEESELYYSYCLKAGWSRQELLARAINLALLDFDDIKHRLDTEAKRIFRIPSRKRSVRENAFGRTGKQAIAGWYPVTQVNNISKELSAHDMTLQDIAYYGLMVLTGELNTNSSS